MSQIRVKVFGAGSIGNHLAHGCRSKGWAVSITDVDQAALGRTRTEIYPARYGAWDDEIELQVADGAPSAAGFDVAIIGTPPDSHFALAKSILERDPPKILLIEKPVATPDLAGCAELWELARASGVCVLVDYNHTVAANTRFARQLVTDGKLGKAQTIQVRWIEHWGGIFNAHPWLSGPSDTYLGFAARGGGACGEHSHGINLWQQFAKLAGAGRVVEVSAMLDRVTASGADYDQVCQLNLRTESGLTGFVVQDVVTEPSVKNLRFQGESGFLDWFANFESGQDAVIHGNAAGSEVARFPKTRPDDFKGMIDQIQQLLSGELAPADAISTLEDGLETMLVIAAAFESQRSGRTVRIDYSKGFGPDAIATS